MLEEACGLLTALLIQKCDKRHAHFCAELMGKIVRMDRQLLGGIPDREIGMQIIFDINHSLMGQVAEVLVGVFLHQTAILLDNIGAEVGCRFRRIQPLDLQSDLIGQAIQLIGVNTAALQGVAQLCIKNNTLILHIPQGVFVADDGFVGGVAILQCL